MSDAVGDNNWSAVAYALLGSAWLALGVLADEPTLYKLLRIVLSASFFALAVYIHRTGRHPIRSRLRWKR